MRLWYYFWTSSFVLAGTAFVAITLVVLVRGIADLREMLSKLRTRAAPHPGDEPLP